MSDDQAWNPIDGLTREPDELADMPDDLDHCLCGHEMGWHDLDGFGFCTQCQCVGFSLAPAKTVAA